MNRFWKDVGISFVMGFILPLMLLALVVSITEPGEHSNNLTEPIIVTKPPQVTGEQAINISVIGKDGQVISFALNDYLTGVILAEMPASFEEEALKAQSVVARTYTMRAAKGTHKHTEAPLCTDSGCCQGYVDIQEYLRSGGNEADIQKIRNVVQATDGQVLTYEGELIEATYFSCSGGMTEDAVAVWGTEVAYLQSVVSPGEEHAAHYTDTVTLKTEDFAEKLGLELEGPPGQWISAVTYTDGGGVDTMTIGGTAFSGTQLRKLLDLRSTAFTLVTSGDTVTIQTRGYGHRVGMSQYGADAMAAGGSTYAQILAHYYRGTELTDCFD